MTVMLEGAPASDRVELDELTIQLRASLLELEVDRVELVRSRSVPAGSKPSDAIALGALAVSLSPIALRGVLRLLETWITNRPIRKVRVSFGEDSIELEQASSEDQRRLVDAFIAAHLPIPGVQPDRDDAPSGT
ncbi:hypothetical protein [Streptomyces luteogriseus]|uniref:Uncharacterized protein n=1 Tax=Streptomyces luteogriseus TaxID=68233 RepID=A0A7W7GGL0_9ACTN|nr:hypothetical protein [Streptomyces luteogriseus]MBB4711498.1 hypothetical protein [Streptomyces luteogriseus]